ncbi:helix-turn-helix domain-containing protein [Mammaliicoccus sciuri]|uniref:helix-turn-helix domain-containing protein n=1 Tax=Mammaliicoccus sciuri TaxID=1296 RepID=UPI00194E8DC6|nr:helix-turn-helix transcriptional regulator [Mammaliicoccus sciuri]
MEVYKNYRTLIKQKRTEKKLTQKEVSKLIGISRSYFSDIENGRSVPSGRVLLKINEVLPIFLIINDADKDKNINEEESQHVQH